MKSTHIKKMKYKNPVSPLLSSLLKMMNKTRFFCQCFVVCMYIILLRHDRRWSWAGSPVKIFSIISFTVFCSEILICFGQFLITCIALLSYSFQKQQYNGDKKKNLQQKLLISLLCYDLLSSQQRDSWQKFTLPSNFLQPEVY